MNITDFTHNHIEQATALAKANYEEERKFVAVLPSVDTLPDLTGFADNGLGVAALENGKMIGFLCCYTPWDNAFGTTRVKGTFSPIHAHGAVYENREMIYKRLYQASAEKWVKSGILSHAIGLYAHDKQAINSFFVNGFGLRCIDAIHPMEEIITIDFFKSEYSELERENRIEILPLQNGLTSHLESSPNFMRHEKHVLERVQKRQSRVFVARQDNKAIAFIEIMNSGENFACDDISMMNICGAYCLLEYRGKSIYQDLLNHLISVLRSEGYTRLGVDFESFNPTAYGFWLKYFTAYTHSVVRRIDEKALEVVL